jgi:putative transposase
MVVSFKGTRFLQEIMLTCVRWYVAYPLSYRHAEELMAERGVSVDHSTVRGRRPAPEVRARPRGL